VTEALHVTNGDSAAHTLEHTSLGGSALPWRDVLHEGPLLALPRPAFLDARAGFLAPAGWGAPAALAAGFRARDEELLRALCAGRPVVLWFEHDLYDQLQLLDVLALVDDAGVPHESLELVQVGSFPGRPGFRGLGELSAGELETLWPQRVPVTAALLGDAAAVWGDVRADDPRVLAGRAASAAEGLPFLAAALWRFLEELPATGDGLSRTERQLPRRSSRTRRSTATPGSSARSGSSGGARSAWSRRMPVRRSPNRRVPWAARMGARSSSC